MSWIEKLENDFVITTGDGRRYTFLWQAARMDVDYNTAIFNFPGVTGSKVDRALRQGYKYPLDLYIKGEFHLDEAEVFRKSADDKRPWTISHPYYGSILCQVLTLSYDNSVHNLTHITGTVMETIPEQYPKGSRNPVDTITLMVAQADALLAASYATNVSPVQADAVKARAANRNIFTDANKFVDSLNAESYFNAFNEADAAIAQLTKAPLDAMRKMQRVVNKPAEFAGNVKSRVALLTTTFSTLQKSVVGSMDHAAKLLYQVQAGTALSAIATTLGSSTVADFSTRTDVLNTINRYKALYNQYQQSLGSIQGAYGGIPGVFMPDAAALNALAQLFNYAISVLFELAQDAKQERSLVLEYDSNWVVIAHRLYGLQPDDSTIANLMQQNNAGLGEMLQVRKGRLVNYYV